MYLTKRRADERTGAVTWHLLLFDAANNDYVKNDNANIDSEIDVHCKPMKLITYEDLCQASESPRQLSVLLVSAWNLNKKASRVEH